jgi:hypothetical protein
MQFIAWLGRTRSFTSRQHDHIVYESSRLKVEQLARRRWSAHVQFQRTAARGESDGSFTGNPESPLHVNPIWVWSRFTTRALLGGSARVPANLMCFPTRVEIRGAVFELEGQALWNELIDDQPSDLREWAAITRIADAATLDRFSRSLVRTGLVAFG